VTGPYTLQRGVDTSWHRDGACTQADPELFFNPYDERGADRTRRDALAVAVCRTCPVMQRCREENLHEQFGVWGGLTEEDRKAIRKGRAIPAAHLQVVPVATPRLATKGQGLDPGPVAAHLARLVEAGVTATTIARFAGMSPDAVRAILRGTTQHVTHITAQRLLSVQIRQDVVA
jgi:WhiB family redox-sensing transcriptional regulator